MIQGICWRAGVDVEQECWGRTTWQSRWRRSVIYNVMWRILNLKFLATHSLLHLPWPPTWAYLQLVKNVSTHLHIKYFTRRKFAVHQAKCCFDDNLPCCPFYAWATWSFRLAPFYERISLTLLYRICVVAYMKIDLQRVSTKIYIVKCHD